MMSAHIFMLSVTNTHSTPQRSEHKHEMICRRLTPNSQSLFYQFAVWMAWNWNHVRLSRWIIEKKKCSKHRMWINQRNSDRDFDRSKNQHTALACWYAFGIQKLTFDDFWFLNHKFVLRRSHYGCVAETFIHVYNMFVWTTDGSKMIDFDISSAQYTHTFLALTAFL